MNVNFSLASISGDGLIKIGERFTFPFISNPETILNPTSTELIRDVLFNSFELVFIDTDNVLTYNNTQLRLNSYRGGFVSGKYIVVFDTNKVYIFSENTYQTVDLTGEIQFCRTLNSFTFIVVCKLDNNTVVSLEMSSSVLNKLLNTTSISVADLFDFNSFATFPYLHLDGLYVLNNTVFVDFNNISYELDINYSEFVYLRVVKTYYGNVKLLELVGGASELLPNTTLKAQFNTGVFVFEDIINDCYIYTADFKVLFYGRTKVMLTTSKLLDIATYTVYDFTLTPSNALNTNLPDFFAMFKFTFPQAVRLTTLTLNIETKADFVDSYLVLDSLYKDIPRAFKYKLLTNKNILHINVIGDTFVILVKFYGGPFDGSIEIQ